MTLKVIIMSPFIMTRFISFFLTEVLSRALHRSFNNCYQMQQNVKVIPNQLTCFLVCLFVFFTCSDYAISLLIKGVKTEGKKNMIIIIIQHFSQTSTSTHTDTSCCVITQTKRFTVLTCSRIETRTETRTSMKLKPNYPQITSCCCNNTKSNRQIEDFVFIVRVNELF